MDNCLVALLFKSREPLPPVIRHAVVPPESDCGIATCLPAKQLIVVLRLPP